MRYHSWSETFKKRLFDHAGVDPASGRYLKTLDSRLRGIGEDRFSRQWAKGLEAGPLRNDPCGHAGIDPAPGDSRALKIHAVPRPQPKPASRRSILETRHFSSSAMTAGAGGWVGNGAFQSARLAETCIATALGHGEASFLAAPFIAQDVPTGAARATAMTATPSSRPTKPIPSLVLPLTLTAAASIARASAILAIIPPT